MEYLKIAQDLEMYGVNYFQIKVIYLLLPHLSHFYVASMCLMSIHLIKYMPPYNPILRFLPWQFSLRQGVPDVIQPPPLWSSSPSFPRHLHHHHSLVYVFFSSHHMPIPLQPTFLHFLGYFSHVRCPSNSGDYRSEFNILMCTCR